MFFQGCCRAVPFISTLRHHFLSNSGCIEVKALWAFNFAFFAQVSIVTLAEFDRWVNVVVKKALTSIQTIFRATRRVRFSAVFSMVANSTATYEASRIF